MPRLPQAQGRSHPRSASRRGDRRLLQRPARCPEARLEARKQTTAECRCHARRPSSAPDRSALDRGFPLASLPELARAARRNSLPPARLPACARLRVQPRLPATAPQGQLAFRSAPQWAPQAANALRPKPRQAIQPPSRRCLLAKRSGDQAGLASQPHRRPPPDSRGFPPECRSVRPIDRPRYPARPPWCRQLPPPGQDRQAPALAQSPPLPPCGRYQPR